MSDFEPIKIDFTVNNKTVLDEFSKMVKAAMEQTKSMDDAQKKFKEYINTQLASSGILSKNATLTEAQSAALKQHASTLAHLKTQIDNTFDPTQQGVYAFQLKKTQEAIQKIIEAANTKIAPIDVEATTQANQKLEEAGRLLDQISDKHFTPQFASPEELEILSQEINKAHDEMEQLGVVIDFVNAKMSSMDSGSKEFQDLKRDIEAANRMLGRTPAIYDTAGNSIDQMSDALRAFKEELAQETDVEKIKVLNQNIETLENAIKKLKNTGKSGFDEFGNQLQENKQKSVNLQTELEQLVQSMARLRIAGKQNSKEYQILRDRAVEVRNAIQRTNQEINASASTTTHLDTLVRATSAIAAGYSMAQGAAALFGAENKEVEQSIMKVTAAMSVLQGLQQIQAELKRNDSILTQAQTLSQKVYTAVVGTSTGALKAFRIALASTGIGLVVVLLGSLIANWDKVTAGIKKSFPAVEGFGDKIDKVKSYVMGFLRAYLSLYETVFKTLVKLFQLDFAGAVNEATNLVKNAKNSFEKAYNESEAANAKDRMNARLDIEIENEKKRIEILKARGRKTDELQRALYNKMLKRYEDDSEKYKEIEQEKAVFEAGILKKRDDEVKKAAEERRRRAEANARKAEQLAQQLAQKRQAALKSIEQAEREYQKSRMQSSEKEIADIEDKYNELKQEAQKAKLGVSELMRIEKLRAGEIKAAKAKQENDSFFKDLQDRKEMYAAYEAFKTKVGQEEADKRYALLVEAHQNYGALLDAEINKIKELGDTITPEQLEKLNKLQTEKKSFDKDKNKAEESKFSDAYNALISFNEKRQAIEEKYRRDKEQLEQISNEKIKAEKLAELEFQRKAAIDAINAEAYERESLMQRMSQNLVGITKRELANRIQSLEEYLDKAGAGLNEEQRKFVENELKKAQAIQASTELGIEEKALLQQKAELEERIAKMKKKGITNVTEEVEELEKTNAQLKEIMAKKFAKVSDVAGELGGAFTELGGALKEYDEGLGDTVETMGDLLNIAGDVAGAAASFASGDIVGGITKSIKAITGLLNMSAKVRESERKAREELKKWNDEIFYHQLAYNEELRKRIQDEVKINDLYKSRVDNIKEEIAANRKSAEMVKQNIDAVAKRLLNSKTIVDKESYKTGGFLGMWKKTKVRDVEKNIAELLGIGSFEKKLIFKLGKIKIFQTSFIPQKNIEITDELLKKLEQIDAAKPLTGDAKEAYQHLKKLKDEYGSLEAANREYLKQLREAATGTTAQALADSIKQGIASGKKSFADFADDIEGFLRNAVLAGLDTTFFKEKVQALHEELEKMIGDGVITTDERDSFNQMYMAIVEEQKKKLELINQAGLNVIKEQENANSLQGAIKGASQESINILSGHMAGLRLHVMDILKIIKANGGNSLERLSELIKIQMNIERNTRRTAENTEKLYTIDEGISKVEKAIKSNQNELKANGF
ncbi:hypothetical protein ACQ1P2_03760 [Ornithobacterium rhinotracheale]|uniref:hypothetical protein n=1 Tax=Ornithobacterium rhinotracheale TaxID=28251 RepID=UPI0039FD0E43